MATVTKHETEKFGTGYTYTNSTTHGSLTVKSYGVNKQANIRQV